MTVLTKVQVTKKEDEPAQTCLVEQSSDENVEKGLGAAPPAEDEPDSAVRYMVLSRRARRVSGSGICVLTAILLAASLCLLFGLFYYRQTHRSQRLHAWCKVMYQDDQPNLPDVELFNPESERRKMMEPIQMQPMFHEEVDIDVRENIEDINVPAFEWGRSVRVFNDFSNSQTALMPEPGRNGVRACMVLRLDVDRFMEPEPLIQRVKRMEEGFGDAPVSVFRERVSIQFPEMEDEMVSPKIRLICTGLPKYSLRVFRSNVFKRSVESEEADNKFAVFGGRGIIQYTITNFDELQ